MMLPIFDYSRLDESARKQVLARPSAAGREELLALVRETVREVRNRGDAAVLEYAARFDGGVPVHLKVPATEFLQAFSTLSKDGRDALIRAITNIKKFHQAQLPQPISLETSPGVVCERITRPIDSIGIYVPGGSAPLVSALLMAAIPAEIAGCKRRVLCTPAVRGGRIHPHILAAAKLCGIDEVYAIGGAQAIAALAYGTETIPKVDKIVGPGSAWVTAAKQIVAEDPEGAALDLPAGPSEVLVIADATARPRFIAADLLAQAEHDPLSQAILLTPSKSLAEAVREAAEELIVGLSRREILDQSLQRSRIVVVPNLQEAFDISNRYAPEHLIIHIVEAREWLDRVTSAGSVFLGQWTPEPLGDYCSGTNHVLPTYGYARAYSGLSVLDFLKRITVQEATPAGLLGLGPTAVTMARIEGLDAHALAVKTRIEVLKPAGT